MPLATILRNRRWLRIADPFPHYYAADVFIPSVHFAIEKAFHDVLARGLSETAAPGRFSRSIPGYDAYGCSLGDHEGIPEPFRLFHSRPWHDLLATVAGVPATGHIQVGLHHHRVGSASGEVHSDFAQAWFADVFEKNGLALPKHSMVEYRTGKRLAEGVRPHPVVRAASMIYFAGTGTWSDGDGGCTGLYRQHSDAVDDPAAVIPPISNSLLLFEITPVSFHSFMTNTMRPRNSVIIFLHCERDYATARWGENRLVPWRIQ